jgi:cytochrome c oxidase assembly protein subunit 15
LGLLRFEPRQLFLSFLQRPNRDRPTPRNDFGDAMTNPVLPLQPSPPVNTTPTQPPIDRVRGLLWKLAFATLVLMAIGSATRVANAGLACPDWPLCYGKLVPAAEMNLQVFLEWFHRLDASLIGLMTIWLVGRSFQWRSQLPPWMPPISLLALLLVVVQGGLGALTVTELLKFEIVTAHLGTALLFFATIVMSAVALLPHISQDVIKPFHSRIHWAGAIAALLVYLQSLIGALVSSQWALHQCLGGFASLCHIMYGHLFGVIPPTLAVLALVIWAWRLPHLHPLLHALAYSSGLLVLVQIGLGFGTFYLHLQVEPLTVAHQLIGATLLGTLLAFFILARRDRPISIYHAHPQTESAGSH